MKVTTTTATRPDIPSVPLPGYLGARTSLETLHEGEALIYRSSPKPDLEVTSKTHTWGDRGFNEDTEIYFGTTKVKSYSATSTDSTGVSLFLKTPLTASQLQELQQGEQAGSPSADNNKNKDVEGTTPTSDGDTHESPIINTAHNVETTRILGEDDKFHSSPLDERFTGTIPRRRAIRDCLADHRTDPLSTVRYTFPPSVVDTGIVSTPHHPEVTPLHGLETRQLALATILEDGNESATSQDELTRSQVDDIFARLGMADNHLHTFPAHHDERHARVYTPILQINNNDNTHRTRTRIRVHSDDVFILDVTEPLSWGSMYAGIEEEVNEAFLDGLRYANLMLEFHKANIEAGRVHRGLWEFVWDYEPEGKVRGDETPLPAYMEYDWPEGDERVEEEEEEVVEEDDEVEDEEKEGGITA
jgi:hypothetical protein